MRTGIRLKPLRRDIPARCELCQTVLKLTARETRLVKLNHFSHDCGAKKTRELAPERDVRGRFVLLV